MPMVLSGLATRSIIVLQLGVPMAAMMTVSFLPMLVSTGFPLLILKIHILTSSFE